MKKLFKRLLAHGLTPSICIDSAGGYENWTFYINRKAVGNSRKSARKAILKGLENMTYTAMSNLEVVKREFSKPITEELS